MKSSILSLLIGLLLCSVTSAQRMTSVTWKKLQASGPELKQIGQLATRHAKEIKSSSWSVGCETLDRDYADFRKYKKFVGELGVKHARLQSGWAKTEKQKGVYNFDWLDEHVNGLKEQGVEPWICICYGNPIYGSEVRLNSGLAPLVQSEEAMAAWLKYVKALVTRYQNVVKTWEIWNEPYGKEQRKNYPSLVIPTAELIKKIQPDSVVMINPHPSEQPYRLVLDALKAADKLDLIDYITYHPYVRNPDSYCGHIEKLQGIIREYSPTIQMYQGETGCPSILEWTHALSHYSWTEYSQAKWNLRQMAGTRVRNIPSSIFTIVDLRYFNMLQSFGLLRASLEHDIIYKRPSYYAVQHMASFFDDSLKAVGELKHQSNSPRKMTVAGFTKNDTPVLLVWYKDQIPSDDLTWDPVDLTVSDATFNDPVYVEMITGKVYQLDKSTWKSENGNTTFTKLPVWDSPMMIAERNQVTLQEAQP